MFFFCICLGARLLIFEGKFNIFFLNNFFLLQGDPFWFLEEGGVDLVVQLCQSMLKYLNNAAKEPWTNKYRSFKLSNKVADQITRVEGGVGLLQDIGFEVHSSPRQDFKATIPVGADLDAMTERLTHLLESIATP